ncbi:gem-associated protein 5-like isoform X2 [Penaeus japonicus]|uniref:gem-associated protein 5-like isoform X2 n=1 Tax=Penaeus japonicus TaxID=27405 RepID=UPI001C715B65|nr:gem-associated protein 5-like isoform X2 [Penaeus japonicus]
MGGEILLPPSPNWFLSNAVDARSEDGLVATASFKSIVVYKVAQEKALPKVIKLISHGNEKVLLVKLHPSASNAKYGHTLASVGDAHSVKLYNMHNGEVIAQHKEHEKSVNGIAWGSVGGEEVIVTVGSGGRMVVWQARDGVTRVHSLPHMNELSCIEVNPKDPSQALVAVQKTVLLVSLKDGKILTQLKGHEYEVYCVKWYLGSGTPLEPDLAGNNSRAEALCNSSKKEGASSEDSPDRGSESKNWRESTVSTNVTGPFFASSDYGRNILLWDVSAKRYIVKANVPHSTSGFKKQSKDKVHGKQHISLGWYDGNLYSSTIRGELLSWSLWPGGAKFKSLHHLHNRAIYNLVIVDDIAVTSGQDRFLQGFHLKKSSHMFQVPTLGASATTLSFCPQDVNRLAIGSFDNNIRLLNFGSPIPLQTQTIFHNINGKVLSFSWHPVHEGRLLFGTATGQVGWTDVASGRVTTFAYHHQKAVYKVEWGLPVCPEKTGSSEDWYAYSFGDREIVMRSSSDPMADPVCLQKLVEESETNVLPKDVTEFSFSPDYKYLALGSQDGQVRVYRRSDLTLVVTLAVVRKTIQHLLWQPPMQSHYSDVLAVGSSEKEIYIFDMEKYLQEDKIGSVITQATRELQGHESRVVWLAWSPHEDGVLASASYDHTIQLWDAKTGEPKVNYGGHLSRAFRVEFSPSDPDLVYSFADENSVHVWRPSEQTAKTPAESSAILKDFRGKKPKDKETETEEETQSKAADTSLTAEKKAGGSSIPNGSKPSSGSTAASKKGAFKSFFPKFHAVCSKKKSFHHLLLLNLLTQTTTEGSGNGLEEPAEDLEDLEEELEEEKSEEEVKKEGSLPAIKTVCEKYSCLLEKDTEMPEPEDVEYALSLYGKPDQIDALLAAEIDAHEKKENMTQAGLIHCWQGSLAEHIRQAAKQRKLSEFLVASAPQVSMKLWQFACESYAEQLIDEGDIITGASYLINILKVEEAINILLKHHYYREALAIAKSRLGCNEEILNKVVTAWAASAVYEGSFDVAALLQLSIGQVEAAARVMSRKSDSGSLFVAAKLYAGAKKDDLAKAIGLLALKEASLKHEHQKIESFLLHLPGFDWYRAISRCHNVYLQLLQQVGSEMEKEEKYLIGNITQNRVDSSSTDGDKDKPETGAASLPLVPLLERVREEWIDLGITQEQYGDLYETFNLNFSVQQVPTNVKQLWFLVTVATCKLLTSPNKEVWEEHLKTALGYALSWGKVDQIFHLTHALLPRGTSDLTTLGDHHQEAEEAVHLLCHIYNYSEISLLHSFLESDEAWKVLETQSSSIDQPKDGSEKEANDEHVPDVNGDAGSLANGNVGTLEAKLETLNLAKEPSAPGNTSEVHDKKRFYIPPQSCKDLTSRLHHYLLQLEKDHKTLQDIVSLSSKVSCDPEKLLREIILKLKEKGKVEEGEIETLNQQLLEVARDESPK